MPKHRDSRALEWLSIFSGLAGLSLALLLGVAALNPEALPWIAEHAKAIGYIALALFGGALLGMCKSIVDLIRESALAERSRLRRKERQAVAERNRLRSQHEGEIRAWEAFYEVAHRALHLYVEVREKRLSSTAAWPGFRRYLQQAEESADALPDPHRSPARRHLGEIVQAIEGEGRTIPAFPETNLIVENCQAAIEWINAHRASYFLPLYRRCGIKEPHWPDRINLPIGDDLERLLLAAEVKPPVDPQSPKSGS